MSKFKEGDNLLRVDGADKGSSVYTIGREYTVIVINSTGYLRYRGDDGEIYSSPDKNWELVRYNSKDRENSKMEYSFNVTSKMAINTDEIKENLTYKRPLAIIKVGDSTIISVYEMLMSKAKLLQILPPSNSFNKSEVKLQHTREIRTWITWAKAVKNADWGIMANKCKVTVILPSI